MATKKKPLGKPVALPEAESDEAATPTQQDISRADALAQENPLIAALWDADEEDAEE